ncbi:MAG: hypothetical protein J0M29_21055 [Chitinophagales bacterium]|nr:hypothetical protein [Chitinophagales bacterium]
MKYRSNSYLLLSFICLLLACNTTPPPPSTKFDLDRPFPLAIGQTGECKDVVGFTVRFDKIAADSRCPKGVECITAGQADVVVTISKGGESSTMTLPFTIPNGTGNATDFKGHTIRIMGVAPMKFKDKEIDPKDYNIMVLVTETQVGGPVAKPGQEFTLGIGEQIKLEADQVYQIRFDTVPSDSRCPEGVQCVWAGKADGVFTVQHGESTEKINLSTGDLSQGGKGEAVIGAYTFKLKAMSPARKKDTAIDPKAYKASLVVDK